MSIQLMPMCVSFSSSDEFAIHTGIAIQSLLVNNIDECIEVYIIDLGISEKNKERINSIVHKYNQKIEYIQLNEDAIRTFLSDRIPLHHGSLATYARLCSSIVYPENVKRIAYIDSDMIICGSIHDIYYADFKEHVVAAVPEISDTQYIAGNSEEEKCILNKKMPYINCGFLIIDICNWKTHSMDVRVKNTADNMHEFIHKDQSILNNTLEEAEILRLPCKYNYMLHKWPQYLLKRIASNAWPLDCNEIFDAAKNPVIIHYVGEMARPWYKENTSCLANEYYKYKSMTPFKDQKMSSIFDSDRFHNHYLRTLVYRFYYRTYQKPIGYPLYVLNRLLSHQKI